MRPVIGLSTYRERARWGVWDQYADLLPTAYARSIELVGGVPALLPPATDETGAAEAAAAVVARLDGLLISGGADVDPRRYGEEPHERTAHWRPDRDGWEIALLTAAESAGLPTLGVCRGMQLMAVHAQGSLDQHTPDRVGHEDHNPGADDFGETVVDLRGGTRLASLLGERLTVHCHHHQSVREHPGFVAVGYAPDGTLEAMEQPGERFCVAVQWHPEMTHDAGLFKALAVAASEYRDGSEYRNR
ncbi:MAG TPA: gamma-glutamyl-gamma-aminobutyrate hydrolase family protein [Nocardioidaceae bacterium]|nr:gamma-glutamyl-gamma-aminobutyrate hydrolase family protein [Nocardioidaceae bacterium]